MNIDKSLQSLRNWRVLRDKSDILLIEKLMKEIVVWTVMEFFLFILARFTKNEAKNQIFK